MCSAECAAIALGLSGISCMDTTLRFARPKMYIEGTANGVVAPLAGLMSMPGLQL